MKKIIYNPTNATSILLAAVFSERNPEAKVYTTKDSGDDFLSLLDEVEMKNDIISLLQQDPETDRTLKIKLGILSDFHDVTNFENQFELLKIFKGDSARLLKVELRGDAIKKFYESPAFSNAVKVFSTDNKKNKIK